PGEACLVQHCGDVEGYQELSFNNEDALCGHPCSRLSTEAKTRVMLGGEVDLNWAVRSSPFPPPGVAAKEPALLLGVLFRPPAGNSSRRSSLQTDKRPPTLVGGKPKEEVFHELGQNRRQMGEVPRQGSAAVGQAHQ